MKTVFSLVTMNVVSLVGIMMPLCQAAIELSLLQAVPIHIPNSGTVPVTQGDDVFLFDGASIHRFPKAAPYNPIQTIAMPGALGHNSRYSLGAVSDGTHLWSMGGRADKVSKFDPAANTFIAAYDDPSWGTVFDTGPAWGYSTYIPSTGSIWSCPIFFDKYLEVRVSDGLITHHDTWPTSPSAFTWTNPYRISGIAFDGTRVWSAPRADTERWFIGVRVSDGSMIGYKGTIPGGVRTRAAGATDFFWVTIYIPSTNYIIALPLSCDSVLRFGITDGSTAHFSAWPAGGVVDTYLGAGSDFPAGKSMFHAGAYDGALVWMCPHQSALGVAATWDPNTGALNEYDIFRPHGTIFTGQTYPLGIGMWWDGDSLWTSPGGAEYVFRISGITATKSVETESESLTKTLTVSPAPTFSHVPTQSAVPTPTPGVSQTQMAELTTTAVPIEIGDSGSASDDARSTANGGATTSNPNSPSAPPTGAFISSAPGQSLSSSSFDYDMSRVYFVVTFTTTTSSLEGSTGSLVAQPSPSSAVEFALMIASKLSGSMDRTVDPTSEIVVLQFDAVAGTAEYRYAGSDQALLAAAANTMPASQLGLLTSVINACGQSCGLDNDDDEKNSSFSFISSKFSHQVVATGSSESNTDNNDDVLFGGGGVNAQQSANIGLTSEEEAGIIVGVAIFIGLLVGLIVFLVLRKKLKSDMTDEGKNLKKLEVSDNLEPVGKGKYTPQETSIFVV